ncbi:MAG: hypothetical protein Kow0092_36680 [Deferrisomatales bacterium]
MSCPTRATVSFQARPALLAAAALAALVLGPAASARARPPLQVPGRLLVRPDAHTTEGDLAGWLRPHGARSRGPIRGTRVHIVDVPPQAEQALLRALARNPRVEFVEPDALVPPDEDAVDPMRADQWFLDAVHAPAAWELSRGEGVVVAVLDTGVDASHPELAGQIVPGWNLFDQTPDTSDVHGHGTAVAGVIAARADNGAGGASVAPGALLLPVRVSRPDGWAYWSVVAQGLVWAADHGARVANISYAVTGSSTVRAAAEYMRSRGGVVVVSAGNEAGPLAEEDDPALVTVSATDPQDTLAAFSGYGASVDLAAPGTGVLTTAPGGGYQWVEGTSFAAPCVAGAAALVLALDPTLSPAQVEGLLFESARDVGAPGWDPAYGFGRVDAAAAVEAARLGAPQDARPPTVILTEPAPGTAVAGTVSIRVAARDVSGVAAVDLLVGAAVLASATEPPWVFPWDTTAAPEGPSVLTARAVDLWGNRAESVPVEVTVDNLPDPPDTTPPQVALALPVDGMRVRRVCVVEASSVDDLGVAAMEAAVDGRRICRTESAELLCVWDARSVSPGTHTVTVRAWDDAGNEGSAQAAVTIRLDGKTRGAIKVR